MQRRVADEGGYTLSEVVIALVIFAVCCTAVMGAIASAAIGSRVHRDVVNTDAAMRQYAEKLTRDGYHAGTNPTYAPMTVGNYTVSVIDPVECWDGVSGANGTASVYGTCTAVGDHGVQRLTLLAARNDGTRPQHLQIVLRQR